MDPGNAAVWGWDALNNVTVVDLHGSPRSVGMAHGQELRDPIRECVDVYRSVFSRTDAQLRAAAMSYAASMRRFSPGVVEEMDAIAEGARVDRWHIYMLNARSELMSALVDGCTAVFVPRVGLLGQTWDWIDALEDLFVVLRVEDRAGHRFATVTEPGIVAKIGFNDRGVGVCLNFLYGPGPLDGVPIHLVLRGLLCSDAESVPEVFRRAGTGRAGNILVGTANGVGWDAEYQGPSVVIHELGPDPYVHANHVDSRPETAGDLWESSTRRESRARALVGSVSDVGSLVALLDDRGDENFPICRPYRYIQGVNEGTTATVIMDLSRQQMHIRRGPRPGAPLQTVEIG